jgi:hypothetical protein
MLHTHPNCIVLGGIRVGGLLDPTLTRVSVRYQCCYFTVFRPELCFSLPALRLQPGGPAVHMAVLAIVGPVGVSRGTLRTLTCALCADYERQ